MSARVAKSIGHAMIQFEYQRGITPGNGLWLASTMESYQASYTYAGKQKWNFGTNFGHSSMEALGLSTGTYRGYNGGFNATRQLDRNFQVISRLDCRQYDVTLASVPNRLLYRVMFGIAFNPKEIALPIR
jgi:hypothetical protein